MAKNRAFGWFRVGVIVAIVGRGLAHPASSPAPTGITPTPDEGRAICLADVASAAPIDESMRADQNRARTFPTRPGAWVHVGWSWVRKARISGDPGFYVNVASCADEALRLAPDDGGALALRGVVLMNAHRFADAEQQAEKVLATEPQNRIALGTLSDALLEQGKFDEAAAAAQRSADVRADASVYARASYFRWLTGDTKAAKDLIRSALGARDRRDPEPAAWTFVEAAKIFWHEGNYDGADALVAEALRWVPDYPPALVARGHVALSQGRADVALGSLEKAYRAQALPETAWLMADARAMLGDAAGAEAESARVVQAGRRGDRLTLALFYATRNRDIDEALRLIAEERAGRGGVYVDDTYAWVLYRAGRIEEARRASDRALRLGTPDARLLYHAGAIRLAAGIPAGRALVEKALALNPGFDVAGAAEARRLLATPPHGS